MSKESTIVDFLHKFSFNPEMTGFIGLEREHFLAYWGGLAGGCKAPLAKSFLEAINDSRWTYELSAYQVESRIIPQRDLSLVRSEILENKILGDRTANNLGLRLVNEEVAAHLFPLEIYPDPRYLQIASQISKEKLDAACRVTGTHVHIGSSDINHAIRINNILVPRLEEFCAIGDHSGGERLRLYKVMADNWQPIIYENPQHLFEVARSEGFIENPRNCWKLIRISIHGTVELRMFGVTNEVDEILEWVSLVNSIIREVM